MDERRLTLTLTDGRLAVCRLRHDAPVPLWGRVCDLWSVTRTGDELSIVCAESCVPEDVVAEKGWRVLKVEGQLDFGLVGVLAGLTGALAEAGVSVFALSTYDTDYLLVRDAAVLAAVEGLRKAGYTVDGD